MIEEEKRRIEEEKKREEKLRIQKLKKNKGKDIRLKNFYAGKDIRLKDLRWERYSNPGHPCSYGYYPSEEYQKQIEEDSKILGNQHDSNRLKVVFAPGHKLGPGMGKTSLYYYFVLRDEYILNHPEYREEHGSYIKDGIKERNYVPSRSEELSVRLMSRKKGGESELVGRIIFFDTHRTDDYCNLYPNYFIGADVVILCFPVYSYIDYRGEYGSVKYEAKECRDSSPKDVSIILCTTKIDLRDDPVKREQYESVHSKGKVHWIAATEGQKVAEMIKAHAYHECSAETQEGMKELGELIIKLQFEKLARKMGHKIGKKDDSSCSVM